MKTLLTNRQEIIDVIIDKRKWHFEEIEKLNITLNVMETLDGNKEEGIRYEEDIKSPYAPLVEYIFIKDVKIYLPRQSLSTFKFKDMIIAIIQANHFELTGFQIYEAYKVVTKKPNLTRKNFSASFSLLVYHKLLIKNTTHKPFTYSFSEQLS